MKKTLILLAVSMLLTLTGCGALQPKYFPNNMTITSSLFPPGEQEYVDKAFEGKIDELLQESEKDKEIEKQIAEENRFILPDRGRVLVVNTLIGDNGPDIDRLKTVLKNNPTISNVEITLVSSLPDLKTLRLMGARQKADYVLVLNSFSNVYRYHNAKTIPTIIGFGTPYFWLNTQTIRTFIKVECSLIDIKNNIILINDSATSDVEAEATLPESGIVMYETESRAVNIAMGKLVDKLSVRI